MDTRVIVSGIMTYLDNYLVMKRSPDNYSPNDWEFVMGFVGEKETAESAVLREVKEETGQEGIIEKKYPTTEIVGRSGRYVIIPYLVRVSSDSVSLNEEHDDYQWAKKNQLLDYKGMIKELVELID